MNWALSIILVVILAWTLIPGGLAAITWNVGHAIGHALASRAFGNPSGKAEDSEQQ